MTEEQKSTLTKLNVVVLGNGNKENSLVVKIAKLEGIMGKITNTLTVMTVFMGILLVVQIPELLRLFGVLL